MMKKLSFLMLTAILMCGSMAFSSCSKDDDNDTEPPVEQPEDDGANSGSDEIGYIECSWDGTKVVKTPKVVKAENLANYHLTKGFEYFRPVRLKKTRL